MKTSSRFMIIVICFVGSVALSGVCFAAVGSEKIGERPKLTVEKADVAIMGFKTDTGYTYVGRSFAVTLKNSGTSVANDIRISIWPVFTDTLQIKLWPKKHFTKTIEKLSGDLYLTVPALGEGESLQILFNDKSLPVHMRRSFRQQTLFPRFFLFHASCMQGSSISDTIYTRWVELPSPAGNK